MSFAFEQPDKVDAAVRTIVQKQIDKALAIIASHEDFDGAVHELRKSCKKIRAVLRLVRPSFDGFKVENDAFGAIASGLSGARDASVMVATFAPLFPHDAETPEAVKASLDDIRARLDARARHVRQQTDEQALLQVADQRFREARVRVGDWTFEAKGVGTLLGGLEGVYRQMRKNLKTARSDESADAIHELRKAAKYHFYHVRLWQCTAPDILGPRADVLERLGELLGDHHNLAVLREWLEGVTLGHDALRAWQFQLIDERQRSLLKEANRLAAQLTAEKPRALAKRFGSYWSLQGGGDG